MIHTYDSAVVKTSPPLTVKAPHQSRPRHPAPTSEFALTTTLQSLLPSQPNTPSPVPIKPYHIHHAAVQRAHSVAAYDPSSPRPTTRLLYNLHHLPPLETVAQAVTAMNNKLGAMFYVFESEAEAQELATSVYNQQPQQQPHWRLVTTMAMLATGGQYDITISRLVRENAFETARVGMDAAIDEAERASARGLGTVVGVVRGLYIGAVYQVIEKRAGCWELVATGLDICRRRGADRHDQQRETSEPEFEKLRRLWGSLCCLESWIGPILGRIPTTTIDPSSPLALADPVVTLTLSPTTPTTTMSTFDPRALQSAVVRISLLIASIQRSLHANPGTSPQPNPNLPYNPTLIAEHMIALDHWSTTLPASLHLSALHTADDANPLTQPQRASMLLAHCKYLSTVMLLTRNVFLNQTHNPSKAWSESEKGWARDCLLAARGLGTVMGILVGEGKLVRKCWIAIYPAFNAALVGLFWGVGMRARVGRMSAPDKGEYDATMAAARKCVETLEWCAVEDTLSQWFLGVLAPYRRLLDEPGAAVPAPVPAPASLAPPPQPQSQPGRTRVVAASPAMSSASTRSESPPGSNYSLTSPASTAMTTPSPRDVADDVMVATELGQLLRKFCPAPGSECDSVGSFGGIDMPEGFQGMTGVRGKRGAESEGAREKRGRWDESGERWIEAVGHEEARELGW